MNSRDAVVDEVAHLFCRPVDAHVFGVFVVFSARSNFPGKREPRVISAMRCIPLREVIGMMPATIGT